MPSSLMLPQNLRLKTPMVPLGDCDFSLQVIPMGRNKDPSQDTDSNNRSADIPKELKDFIE